ncbi:MAG: Na+/H+ antiporter subunit E [Rhodococcus sp. (in: high G+C Gram-positive bacteria)]
MRFMNRFLLLRLWTLAFLTAVWVLLWGNVSYANVLGGIVVGLGIMILLPLPKVPVEGRIHVFSLLRLIGLFSYLAAESSVNVAWLAIRPQKPPVTGVVRFRIAIKSDLVLTLFVDGLNLFPGTMVLEIDQSRRLIYVHLLDMGSQKAVDSFFHSVRRLENLFIAAFERDSDWKPSPHHAEERYHGIDGDEPGDAVLTDEAVANDLSAPAERRDDKKADDERKGDWK